MTESTSKNRRLSDVERVLGHEILDRVRQLIEDSSKGDTALAWALRRYVYVRLQNDERDTPMRRRMLKLNKMIAQKGLCAKRKGITKARLVTWPNQSDGWLHRGKHAPCSSRVPSGESGRKGIRLKMPPRFFALILRLTTGNDGKWPSTTGS